MEQLAKRYQALHVPAALLTPARCACRVATAALWRERTASKRRRLLRNRATVAILASHLAYEDLGDAVFGRASYGVAMDSA